MPGSIFPNINPSVTSGTDLAALLNSFRDIIVSGFRGTSRPAGLLAGGYWIDTTNDPNYWEVKVFDGTADIVAFTLNLTEGTVSVPGASSAFSLTRKSDDAVGAILKFFKERIAGSGATQVNDVLGQVDFHSKLSDLSKPVSARLRVLARDNGIPTEFGAEFIVDQVFTDSASLVEVMRLRDGRLSFGGVTAPQNTIHARGNGIRSEQRADDANGARLLLRKLRISGGEQVLASDEVGRIEFFGTTNTGAEAPTAYLSVISKDAMTASAQGSKIELWRKPAGSSTYAKVLDIDTDFNSSLKGVFGGGLDVTGVTSITGDTAITGNATVTGNSSLQHLSHTSLDAAKTTVASATNINALNATRTIIELTGSIATNLNGVAASSASKEFTIHNTTDQILTIVHDSSLAAAGDKILLPEGENIEVLPESSISLFYSPTDTAWKLKSGSGSGAGGDIWVVSSALSLTGTPTLTLTNKPRQVIRVQGASAAVTLSSTPFTVTGIKNGTEVMLIGNSDTNTVTINANDATNGAVGNFTSITLHRYETAKFVWIEAISRWIYHGG